MSYSNKNHSVSPFKGIDFIELSSFTHASPSELLGVVNTLVQLNQAFDNPRFAQPALRHESFTWQVALHFGGKWHIFEHVPGKDNDQDLQSFIAQVKLTYG